MAQGNDSINTQRYAHLKYMKSMISEECMKILQLEGGVIYLTLDLLLQKRKLGGKADTVGRLINFSSNQVWPLSKWAMSMVSVRVQVMLKLIMTFHRKWSD